MPKIVIYTSISGNYDEVPQPTVIDNDIDFICFTDDIKEPRVGIWEIRRIPYSSDNNLRKSRYVKLLPHKVLQEYDISIWMDANIQITGREFYDNIRKNIESKIKIAQVPHISSNCIYKEIRKAFYGGKVSGKDAKRQYGHLRQMGFPENMGLFENNIILRWHNDPQVVSISEDWWNEYSMFSERDQFSLMYIYWKHGFKPVYLIDSEHNSRNVPYLRYILHPSIVSKLNRLKKENQLKRAIRSLYKKAFIRLCLS